MPGASKLKDAPRASLTCELWLTAAAAGRPECRNNPAAGAAGSAGGMLRCCASSSPSWSDRGTSISNESLVSRSQGRSLGESHRGRFAVAAGASASLPCDATGVCCPGGSCWGGSGAGRLAPCEGAACDPTCCCCGGSWLGRRAKLQGKGRTPTRARSYKQECDSGQHSFCSPASVPARGMRIIRQMI